MGLERVHVLIFASSKQSFNKPLDFATVHSQMNDTNMTESCQAHLPVQYALSIELTMEM